MTRKRKNSFWILAIRHKLDQLDFIKPENVLEAFVSTEKKAVLELADTSSCVKIASAMPCCKIVV